MAPAVAQLFRLKKGGSSPYDLAYRFHFTIADLIKEIAITLRENTGINQICLSGGVFQNRLLNTLVEKMLRNQGFDLYLPARIPVNDGGLALGQAVIALAKLSKI
ncbi:MAG: hypothetical protein K8F91_19375, partial [Candidatus Obscuribacterales bacterium]|nr:hypothetical protein [Candidatus Obscuribacterales bacterium]